jgi:AraC-like DNA-binding protein
MAGAATAAEIAAYPVAESVVRRSNGSLEAMKANYEGLILELGEAMSARADLDARSLQVLERGALGRLSEPRNAHALSLAFQKTCGELAESMRRPFSASRDARLERARRYVDTNLHLSLRLKDVAREAGLSDRYFSGLFKRKFGEAFEKYLAARRLERARELLLTTDWTVARISREAGFGSGEYFFRAFKRAYGVTPAASRET